MNDESPIVKESPARKVSRRELAQRLLSGIAGGVLFPRLSQLHPVYDHLLNGTTLDSADEVLGADKHKPLFLSAPQLLSLEKVAEGIVPGSRKAQSAAFIDLLLSVDSTESQQHFTTSLAAFETAASQAFHKSVGALSDAQLNELLRTAAARDSENLAHFEDLKNWAVGAYYSSEIGMRELGWTPDRVFSTFPVCSHAETHS